MASGGSLDSHPPWVLGGFHVFPHLKPTEASPVLSLTGCAFLPAHPLAVLSPYNSASSLLRLPLEVAVWQVILNCTKICLFAALTIRGCGSSQKSTLLPSGRRNKLTWESCDWLAPEASRPNLLGMVWVKQHNYKFGWGPIQSGFLQFPFPLRFGRESSSVKSSALNMPPLEPPSGLGTSQQGKSTKKTQLGTNIRVPGLTTEIFWCQGKTQP